MNLIKRLSLQLTPAFKQMLAHVAIVFLVAFGASVSAGLTNAASIPTLLALLIAGGSAGLTAVVHYLLGFIPSSVPAGKFGAIRAVPAAVETKLLQVAVSVVAMFLVIAGTSALAGAVSVSSLPSAVDLIVAAIAAGVTGAVQYATGLLPKRLQ